MMTALLAIFMRIWPYLLIAVGVVGLYAWDDHRCNAACLKETARADKLQAAADTAKQRATDLALLYANTLTKAEKDTQDALAQQKADFTKLAEDASHLSALPSIVISGDALRVFDAASALANAAPAPEVDHGASQAISESDLAAKWSAAAEAYSDAVTKLHACINTYEGLRNEQVR